MKLTKSMKERIENRAITDVFQKQQEELDKLNNSLYKEIINYIIPREFKESTYPTDWFPTIENIKAKIIVGNDCFILKFQGVRITVPYYIFEYYKNNFYLISFNELPSDILFRINSYIKKETNLNSLKKEFKQKLKSLLNSVNTVKQLLEIFPEVTKYYQFNEPIKNLPINQKDINFVKSLINNKDGD